MIVPTHSTGIRRASATGLAAMVTMGILLEAGSGAVRITELMAANDGAVLVDEDGDASDWIEVHNGGPGAVDLGGWYLTDDVSNLSKWTFPQTVLGAGEYLVVFASGKGRANLEGERHTGFRLDADGEPLLLVRPDGLTVAGGFSFFPEQHRGVSFGPAGGAGGEEDDEGWYFQTPTPGAANGSGVEGFVGAVVFSHGRGYYDAPVAVAIESPTDGASVWYSTDGSEPGPGEGSAYDGPVNVARTTVLRAVAHKDGYAPSPVATRTFLFLDDIVTQAAGGVPPDGWPDRPVNGQAFYYQMHPDLVARVGAPAVRAALMALPSLSLVTPLDNLVDRRRGIYVNAGQRGREWERPASLELVGARDGGPGFQVGCGVRIRGGISRDPENPKHALRLLFRDEYGDGKLRHRMFGDEGTGAFDNLDLRTSTNWNWAWFGDFRPGALQNTFLRDIVSRDTQRDVGQDYTRSRYYHLYLNGVYWGVFMTQERAEASFAESYLGGAKEDYDVIKINRGPGSHTEATDGDLTAWRELWRAARSHRSAPDLARYLAMQGLGPDGSRDPGLPVLLDVDQLIDYMLTIFWTANNDAPVSQWGDNDWSNNWYGIRDRTAGDRGFRFFVHDAENTFGIRGYDLSLSRVITTEDRTGPYNGSNYRTSNFEFYNPQFLHQDLLGNPEYRLRFADRVQRHCYEGGALTDGAVETRLLARRAEVGPAILANAARWGYRSADRGLTYDEREWNAAADKMVAFVGGRTGTVLSQLDRDGLLAEVSAPKLSQHGGTVPAGFSLTVTADVDDAVFHDTAVLYSLDGSDPRSVGGGVAAGVEVLGGPVALTGSSTFSARVRATRTDGGAEVWSALNQAVFLVDTVAPSVENIVVSEVHYHPAAPTDEEGIAGFDRAADFEFIELHNPTPQAVSLRGVRVVDGVGMTISAEPNSFPALPAGGFAVLVNNLSAFRSRYGDAPVVLGEFSGNLSDGGERFVVLDGSGAALSEVVYDDRAPWPVAADGAGASLVLVGPRSDGGGDASRWAASGNTGGSPGELGSVAASVAVVTSVRRPTGAVVIAWLGTPGETFLVEYSPRLAVGAPSWEAVGEVVAVEGETTFEDRDPGRAGGELGFYRVRPAGE